MHTSSRPTPLPARPTARVLLSILALAVTACDESAQPRARDAASAAAGAAATAANAASSPADSTAADPTTACRMSGAWQRCSAVESVERAGYRVALLRDSVVQPGLAVAGTAYRLGPAELQLFVFADSAAAAHAAAAVDADDAEPAETRGILRPPAVIRTNNLVALLFDNNDRLRERVQLALAAGLPPD